LIGACTPADTSPMRRRVSGTVSADSPKAINLQPASASSGNSKGVSAPSLRSLASVCSAIAASPISVENATFVCSKPAAELTAFTPTPIAAAPPAKAAPMPALSAIPVTANPLLSAADPPLPSPASPALVIFPMRRADAATNSVAPAIARFRAVMSAPRVTVRALMRRG
jgi:hypothetical protein